MFTSFFKYPETGNKDVCCREGDPYKKIFIKQPLKKVFKELMSEFHMNQTITNDRIIF